MEIYGICLWHKRKFQPMCHDMGSACYGCFRHSRRVCRYFNVSEKRLWVLFLNDKNRIQYNDQCKKCVHDCKQSFRCRIVWCGKYCSKRRKRQNQRKQKPRVRKQVYKGLWKEQVAIYLLFPISQQKKVVSQHWSQIQITLFRYNKHIYG